MIPELLSDHANRLLECIGKDDTKTITNAVFLYANDFQYHEEYFKLLVMQLFKLDHLPEPTEHEESYKHTPYYFQFDMSNPNESIPIINQILKNRNVLNKKFVFYLTNVCRTGVFNRILDRNSNALFVFSAKTCHEHHQGLLSRSMLINMSFKLDKVYKFLSEKEDLGMTMTLAEFKEAFQRAHYSIPVFISKIETDSIESKAKYEQAICDLLDSYKNKKADKLELVKETRELCYKLYHLCISLSHIAKICILHLEKHKKIHEIVKICAEAEHKSVISHKSILCYEQMFMRIAMV